jgi:RNA polymerase sigma-70 factor (ECF subfamily)
VLEDRLLVHKLKHGSREALCRIYEKYRDDLLRLASSLMTESTGAEDVVHDVFTCFVRSAKQFRLTGSLRGYLTTCVANRARNANRAKQRQRATGLDEAWLVTSDLHRPDRWIISSEQSKRLNEALAQLPYEQREVVVLHLQGRMKFREIAKLQKAPVKTVQSRYRYALDKLRSLLDSEFEK